MHDIIRYIHGLGNRPHEVNVVAFRTPHPHRSNEPLRPHLEKNRQHAVSPNQGDQDSVMYTEMITWRKISQRYVDSESLRDVHACGQQQAHRTPSPLNNYRQPLTKLA